MSDMLNVSARLTTWQRAQSQIQRQYKHGWVLNGIDKPGAEKATQDALRFAADLRHLADVVEQSAAHITTLLEDKV